MSPIPDRDAMSEALQQSNVQITATFEGRFVYRVRCSYHGTVTASTDRAVVEAAKVTHLIEHDLTATETP